MRVEEAQIRTLSAAKVVDLLGRDLLARLTAIASALGGPLYLAGGTVRDLLLGRTPADIDLTVPSQARKWAAELSRMTGGAYVPLGRDEDAARVVWLGRDIDFSSFREGAESIGEELEKRDITVNSMAVCLDGLLRSKPEDAAELEVIDPTSGLADLDKALIRITSPYAFTSDPLRLLRVFRFAATLGFAIDADTMARAVRQRDLITRPAAERVAYELNLIMKSDRAYEMFSLLAESGLLFRIIPELEAGKGMEQPDSHHLDVFDHCLDTLRCMVDVQRSPGGYFPEYADVLEAYIARGNRLVQLRWAALLHDIGKPDTVTIDEDRGGRITFYNHDQAGAHLIRAAAARLKWSSADAGAVAGLAGMHMRPFHLCNVQRKQGLSLKACLRLARFAGPDLPGLFLLAMADSMAGKGKGRPEEVESEVAALFARVEKVRRERVAPVRSGPPLLTGRDLIEELGLAPGPVFRKILDGVEEAHMLRKSMSRKEALEIARTLSSS